MNAIIINNKQYIFLETSEDVDCDKCDFHDRTVCSVICTHFHSIIHGNAGCGVFKELKEEK